MDRRILKGARAVYEVNKSKFIATVAPVSSEEEAKAFIDGIRKEFRDASHNCSAYILDGGRIERYSDDGEPSGTAGLPMLEVLRGGAYSQAAAVVTRYFGGVKLGTGGLVRAYTKSLQQALEEADTAAVGTFCLVSITVAYNLAGKVQYHLEQAGIHVEDVAYGEDVAFKAILEKEALEQASAALTELAGGQAAIRVLKTGEGFKSGTTARML